MNKASSFGVGPRYFVQLDLAVSETVPLIGTCRKLCSFCVLSLLLLIIICSSSSPAAASPSAGTNVFVQIKNARLMDQPKLWGKSIATVGFGDELTVVSDSGSGWLQVRSRSGKSGYLHQSALTTTKIVLRSGGSAGPTGASDVVLAGKGFNRDVEKQFSQNNSAANFRAVDQMEQTRIGPGDLAQFIKQGQLSQ